MEYYITEYIGTDKIKIGMSLDEIKKLLTNEKYSIFKENNPLNPYKICCNDFMIFFNPSDICDTIDFYCDNKKVIFKDKNIMGEKYVNVIYFFKSIDNDIYFYDSGFFSLKYDIGVYKEPYDLDPTEARIKSVSVYEKGGCQKYIEFLESNFAENHLINSNTSANVNKHPETENPVIVCRTVGIYEKEGNIKDKEQDKL